MKFRVYDNVDKKYVGTGISNNLFVITQSGLLFEYNLKGTFKEAYLDRYTVEFSTGLKDKNGVEIYEGDCVEVIHPCWTNICEVRFSNGSFIFFSKEDDNFGSTIPGYTFMKESWKIKITGNIHEAK